MESPDKEKTLVYLNEDTVSQILQILKLIVKELKLGHKNILEKNHGIRIDRHDGTRCYIITSTFNMDIQISDLGDGYEFFVHNGEYYAIFNKAGVRITNSKLSDEVSKVLRLLYESLSADDNKHSLADDIFDIYKNCR